MEIEYIIIQAGGKGTRLGHLTQNRPKAIVPVNNLPVIFHLFQKYPDARYLIIGDYKYEALRDYLEVFAQVRYLLIRSQGEGNVCGIKKALEYIPDQKPVLLLWSDLLLDQDLSLDSLERASYIGVTDRFTCSWKYENYVLEKSASDTNGVAGLFLFENKERLLGLPKAGSFTRWLKQARIRMEPLPLLDTKEAGSIASIQKADTGSQNRCRPYNKMTFTKDQVVKEGLTEEGKRLIRQEAAWYRAVSKHAFDGIPQIEAWEPLTMKRIDGENIFKAQLSDQQKRAVIDQLVEKLDRLHHLESIGPDVFDLKEDYCNKTWKRLNGIRNVIPFANEPYLQINGKKCRNIFFFRDLFQQMTDQLLESHTQFGLIHGDCTLTNTMIDREGRIYFIDARGYFGRTPLVGDVDYDWAKLYYSIQGSFDQFNIKNFELAIKGQEVCYQIAQSGWEPFTDYFLHKIPACDEGRLRLIHAVIWLSLASHCWEDYDSMCLAFYQGIYLWNACIWDGGIGNGKDRIVKAAENMDF